jgi:hypothetical protein
MSAWVYLDWSEGVHVCCKWRVENVNLFSSSKKEKLVTCTCTEIACTR